jgi:hypothetical protein
VLEVKAKGPTMTRPVALFLLPTVLFLSSPRVLAQVSPNGPVEPWQNAVLTPSLLWPGRSSGEPLPTCRGACIRLFRIPTAFPTEPLGLDDDDTASDVSWGTLAAEADMVGPADDNRLAVALGGDNPFFDFQLPGDPGGVGYYRLHSQLLLFDSNCSGVSVGFRAVTPAGLEADGVANGPTYLSPNCSWFYDLGSGLALQGFAGSHLRANSRWRSGLGRRVECGMALQSAVPGLDDGPLGGVHFFVEALGRYRCDEMLNSTTVPNWDLVPGIHWQLSENWWMSGGLLMPLGSSRFDSRLWQITCSWQF